MIEQALEKENADEAEKSAEVSDNKNSEKAYPEVEGRADDVHDPGDHSEVMEIVDSEESEEE